MLAPPEGLTAEDFEKIEEAVLETERGRWFLQEYARRLRAAETAEILAAVQALAARDFDQTTARRDVAEALAAMFEAMQRLSTFALGAAPRQACVDRPEAAPSRPKASGSGELDRRLAALKELDALNVEAKVKLFG